MIRAESLQKKYGTVAALRDVSLSVNSGEIVGFIGPNGSGKSTSLRIISGLEREDQGSCTIDGEPAGRISHPWSTVATLLDRQGVNGELSASRALSALASAYKVSSDRVTSLLAAVGLDQAKDRKVRTFSLGMKQRLNIALALIAEPTYLILDEPMNGLDPDGILWFREFLFTYRNRGCGILLSSHTLSEVEAIADTFVMIKNGSTVWQGSKAQLARTAHSKVAATDQALLCAVLEKLKYQFVSEEGRVFVRDVPPETLGPILYHEGVALTHLGEVSNSLEDLYLSFSSDRRGA